MKRIEFHDREQETKEIMDVLDAEPSLLTFIYTDKLRKNCACYTPDRPASRRACCILYKPQD
ncbi:MAG: hypothetical protein U9Q68_03940 [Euryarchaeota archaeon]|nr:hypothetical protein [Euryarchaeota archaeon]